MATQPIPAGFHTITPYLMVTQGARFIEFMQAAFGAEIKHVSKSPDGLIMHASLLIGDSMLMLSDARGNWQPQAASFYLYVPNVDESYRRAKSAGAETVNEPRDEFYGDRMAGVKDFLGNTWWIATHVEDVSEEELRIRQQKLFGKTSPS